MAQQIKSAAEVIDALGGSTAVARLFGVDVRVVSNWKRSDRGLPAYTFVTLERELRAKKLSAPPTLWRMWAATNAAE